jgi:dihydroxyacetone kinase
LETSVAVKGGAALAEGLAAGIAKMARLGGAKVGSRTMLDALVPAVDALAGSVRDAAAAAEAGAQATQEMAVAAAGRSSYLRGDALIGNPDPGAVAIAVIFRAIADQITE